MYNWHVDRGSRKIDDDSVTYGRNSMPSEEYIRCRKCGYKFNALLRSKGTGWGNVTLEETSECSYNNNTNYSSRYVNYNGVIYDPVVKNGCPLCGTSIYE